MTIEQIKEKYSIAWDIHKGQIPQGSLSDAEIALRREVLRAALPAESQIEYWYLNSFKISWQGATYEARILESYLIIMHGNKFSLNDPECQNKILDAMLDIYADNSWSNP